MNFTWSWEYPRSVDYPRENFLVLSPVGQKQLLSNRTNDCQRLVNLTFYSHFGEHYEEGQLTFYFLQSSPSPKLLEAFRKSDFPIKNSSISRHWMSRKFGLVLN